MALRRTIGLRRRSRVGRAAQERRKAGGKLAVGRQSASLSGWRAVVEVVKARAKGRCEIATWDHPGQDPHHVIPRSLGGDDTPANVIWICRFHHDLVDVPFGQGRLVIVAMGDGQRFKWEIVRKRDKWATDLVVLGEGVTRG